MSAGGSIFRWLVTVPIVIAGAFLAWMLVADRAGAAGSGAAMTAPGAEGPDLYLVHCASCHGADGAGVTNRGPSLLHEGRAAADFALRTGRMPLADSDVQPSRGPVHFDDAEIRALVDYVGTIGDGPDIPTVDVGSGMLADGASLFRLNCAACHVASGAGAAIGTGGIAPSLMQSTPVQVGEAVRIGPGAMPVFGAMTDRDLDDLASYVVRLQHDDTTGATSLGGVGPVAEGLAAWAVGLGAIVALTRWIGSPADARREHEPGDAPT
jgi:ubiquinol-cytochrome c reductase cytochrome c subunit